MRSRFLHLVDVLQFWPKHQPTLLADIYSLTQDGVPLTQAIDTIEAIHDGIINKVALNMAHALSQGQSLAAGMESWYPLTITEIIRSGEEGGTFVQSLESAVQYYKERVFALKMAIQSLVYPIIVILVALVMLVVIKNSVLTNFALIKPVSLWPVTGQQVYALASFIQNWWWFALFMLLAISVGIYYVLQHVTGEVRYQIDRVPLLSLYRQLIAARFMETLGLLITNGVALKEAFQIIARHAEPYLAWHLMVMEYNLGSGLENMADVLDTALITRNDMLRLRVVAKGKGFDHALVSLGRQALRRYGESVSLTVKIMGALLLVFGAMLAGMIVLGIYSVGSSVAS